MSCMFPNLGLLSATLQQCCCVYAERVVMEITHVLIIPQLDVHSPTARRVHRQPPCAGAFLSKMLPFFPAPTAKTKVVRKIRHKPPTRLHTSRND